MGTSVSVQILGAPAPQGSKKHVGNGRLVEQSKKLPAWRKAILHAAKTQAAHHGALDGQLTCTATFILPRPANSKFDGPAGPPDLDKLQRALGDGLEAGGLITNDSRIVEWHTRKRWANDGEPTGAIAHIQPYEGR